MQRLDGPKGAHAVHARAAVHHYALKSQQDFVRKMARGSGMSNVKGLAFWWVRRGGGCATRAGWAVGCCTRRDPHTRIHTTTRRRLVEDAASQNCTQAVALGRRTMQRVRELEREHGSGIEPAVWRRDNATDAAAFAQLQAIREGRLRRLLLGWLGVV